MTDKHPRPWRIAYTEFGESMGYDSKTMILDANGLHVITVGSGTNDVIRRSLEESIADLIVDAANSGKLIG